MIRKFGRLNPRLKRPNSTSAQESSPEIIENGVEVNERDTNYSVID